METKKFLDGEGLKTLWDEITALQSDYNETDETSPNYIKNKPFTIDVIPEEIIEEFTFTTSDKIDNSTGLPTMQYVQMFGDLTIGQKMNLQFTYPKLAAATGQPQYDDNGNIITKTVRYENVEVGNFADAMGSQFLDSPAVMMGPGALIATLPESIQRVAIPNDDIVFVYSNATLANGAKTPLLITALMDWSAEGYSTHVATCHTSTFTTEKIDLIASRENHIALQSDWDEQNVENSSYIQNKPFGDEIILTPKNEFYRDGFVEWHGDENSGWGNPGYTLQTEIGKQYTLQIFGVDGEVAQITLTCVGSGNISGLNVPEGTHFLGDFDSDGKLQSLTFLIDNATITESEEEILYDESSCMIPFTKDIYKIVILDTPLEGTYERIVTKKIDSKYLPKADQSYNWTSENAQSGIAVNEAVSRIQNRLPSSVITNLLAPTTLGDKHVKVQFNSTNSNTFPYSSTYNIYTEGIGLNSDLKTNSRGTLVDAINENKTNITNCENNIQNAKTEIKTYINDIHSKTTIATPNTKQIFNEGKQLLISDNETCSNAIPYKYSYDLNTSGNKIINSKIFSWGGYVIDLDNKVINYFDTNGEIKSKTLSGNIDTILENVQKILFSPYIYTYYRYFYHATGGSTTDNERTTSQITMIALLKDNTYASFNIQPNGFVSTLTTLDLNYQEGFFPHGSYWLGQDKTVDLGQAGILNHKTYNYGAVENVFLPTTLEKPGKLISAYDNKSYGTDDLSNTQVIAAYNSSKKQCTFYRSLNSSGLELLYGKRNAQNCDDNEHSSYCIKYEDKTSIMCITSASEILIRKAEDGAIVKKYPIIDNFGLCSKNLQYVSLINYKNILYVNDNSALYCLNLNQETPILTLLEEFDKPYNMYLQDDTLVTWSENFDNTEVNFYCLRRALSPDNELFVNIQPDYNQNDSTRLDYIKNKPITAEYATNYLTKDKSIPVAQQMGNSAFVVEDQFIGLVIGEKYDIDMNITSTIDNSTTTQTFKKVECVDMRGFWKQSSVCPGIVIAPELMFSLYPSLSYATLSDGLVFMYTNNFNGAAYDETKCITCVGEMDGTGAANTNITITVNVSQTSVEGEISEPYAKFLQADWSEKDETKVGYIKNKPSTGDYYFFNLKDFADIGYATKQYAHAVKNPSSNVYNDYFAINVVLGLGGVKEQTYYNITNIPYETLCINDYPYITDKHRFKNMGLKSPAFKQLLNYDGIVWFDAIEDCLRDILTENFSSLYTITRQYSDMMIGFVIYGEARRSGPSTMNPKVQQAIGLWDAVLNDPDTQIVIEYQSSQNVQHIEGQLIMSVAELGEVE